MRPVQGTKTSPRERPSEMGTVGRGRPPESGLWLGRAQLPHKGRDGDLRLLSVYRPLTIPGFKGKWCIQESNYPWL